MVSRTSMPEGASGRSSGCVEEEMAERDLEWLGKEAESGAGFRRVEIA